MTDVQQKPAFGLGRIGLIFACGTSLFSDGYQNGVIGTVNTIIKIIYKDDTSINLKRYSTIFSSLAFAGTIVGMLGFGMIADRIGRRVGMLLATGIIVVFAALSAGAYGANGSVGGMLAALSAYRFLLGIGIGAEYPAGSVAASENTEEPGIKTGVQHLLFVYATNVMIDWGFVISAFTPLVLLWIFGEDHLRIVWRGSLALGVIPALFVFIWRVRMHEPQRFVNESMKRVTWKQYPLWLIVKRYWARLAAISATWFIYDFIVYPFSIYSSTIVTGIIGDTAPLTTSLGWNVVINLFYIPGCMLGALFLDKVGPRWTMTGALIAQGIIGFAMSGAYTYLAQPTHIAGFAVMYGIFLTLGEVGPGNNLGLFSSKSSPTAFRGIFYGIAAAIGKVGAFVGTWAFPAIIDAFPPGPKQDSGPFWIGSGLAFLSAGITWFFVPDVPNNHMTDEDRLFREYLIENGFDINLLGIREPETKMETTLPREGHDTDDSSDKEKVKLDV